MHKLSFTLHSAQHITDPKQRALLLAGAALDEARTLHLLARVLHEAEVAAASIEDPDERARTLSTVRKAIERVGYNQHENAFNVPQRITA